MDYIEKHFLLNGIPFVMSCDHENTLTLVTDEIKKDNYRLNLIDFNPGDVVIDIGANIGVVSIYLAKKYPEIKVISVEPIYKTYLLFMRNIWLNNVTNIIPLNCAVTCDCRQLPMVYDNNMLGGSSSFVKYDNHDVVTSVNSITLDDIFDLFGLTKLKLLKIDCEGAEYEILYGTSKLPNIEYVRGEFHINDALRADGRSWDDLATHIANIIGYYPKIYYEYCEMAN